MGHDAAAAAVTDEDHEDNEITRPQLSRSDSDVKSAERGRRRRRPPPAVSSQMSKTEGLLSPIRPGINSTTVNVLVTLCTLNT